APAAAATAYPAPAAAPAPAFVPTQASYPYPAPSQPNPVAATATPAAPGAPATTAQGELVFGAPLGTTGANAVEGGLTRNGYNTWVKYVNLAGGVKAGGKQYKVSIKYYDDASNPDQSAQLTERLITQDGIKLLFGPYGSAPTFSATSVAEKYKVVMVEGNGAASNIFSRGYKYIFGTLSPAAQYGAVMLDLAVHLTPKPSTVVILSANDSFSVEVGTAAETFAKQNGLTVTRHDKYPANATDLSAVVTQAKQTGADILLNSGHLPESLAIMKSAKELDFSPKLFCFTVGPTTPDFLKTLGGDAEGVVASTQWTEVEKWQGTDIFGTPQKFNQLYQQDFNNQVPDYHVADGASVGVVMQVAIEKANSLEPDAVRDALSKLDLMTFYGPIKFDERGVNTAHPMAVQQIQKGKLPTIWPAEVSNASPAYPTPAWSAR
ncbi:MAG TPA: amino acid ABC transporter substrate-binding protein, partial [Chloroflexota bacterium]